VGKASLREQAADAAALAQAAFAGHVPEAPAGEDADAGEVPNTSADADLALALQMQEVGRLCQGAIGVDCISNLSCLASCSSRAVTTAGRGCPAHTGFCIEMQQSHAWVPWQSEADQQDPSLCRMKRSTLGRSSARSSSGRRPGDSSGGAALRARSGGGSRSRAPRRGPTRRRRGSRAGAGPGPRAAAAAANQHRVASSSGPRCWRGRRRPRTSAASCSGPRAGCGSLCRLSGVGKQRRQQQREQSCVCRL
jgi:hypothetical protein